MTPPLRPLRALVLGARGAVGAAAAAALASRGHTVIAAGRRAPTGGVAIDAQTTEGLAALARHARTVDVVMDATGLEHGSIQRAIGTTPLVDVSATSAHLKALAAGVPAGGAVLLGAGIAPGLSTVLVRALDTRPGADVDVAVMLGGGEAHGAAAVEWTVRLAGRELGAPPEAQPVLNLRSSRRLLSASGRRRTHLRADFPDDLLVGESLGVAVRSWLAMDTAIATGVLRVIGALPSLAPILRRAPHIGSDAWEITVIHRRTGHVVSASGHGQSGATGRLAARAAERLVERGLRGAVTMADVLEIADVEDVVGALTASVGAESPKASPRTPV